jgi:hypothetical protein
MNPRFTNVFRTDVNVIKYCILAVVRTVISTMYPEFIVLSCGHGQDSEGFSNFTQALQKKVAGQRLRKHIPAATSTQATSGVSVVMHRAVNTTIEEAVVP